MSQTQPARTSVIDLAAHAEQLPLLPTVVMRVLALDTRSDQYFEALLAVAEEDPTFAVRLIRLANAPRSAPAKPIITIRQAVVRLGARGISGICADHRRTTESVAACLTSGRCGSHDHELDDDPQRAAGPSLPRGSVARYWTLRNVRSGDGRSWPRR